MSGLAFLFMYWLGSATDYSAYTPTITPFQCSGGFGGKCPLVANIVTKHINVLPKPRASANIPPCIVVLVRIARDTLILRYCNKKH